MEKRVEKAIDVLLDSLNNGTLAKGTCAACAVGNLVGAAIGVEPKMLKGEIKNAFWGVAFAENPDKYVMNIVGQKQIAQTDFSYSEIVRIESAFEENTDIYFDKYPYYSKESIRADQIRGLEAVVKCMLSFSGDKESDVKQVFTEKAELIEIK